MRSHRSSRQELSEIEELHERDRKAVESGDFNKLRALMDEDAVVLAPGRRAEQGAAELNAAFAVLTDTWRQSLEDLSVDLVTGQRARRSHLNPRF